jgi:septum formation protein
MPSPDKEKLILASGSRFKRDLFSRLDLPFLAINADVDETPKEDEPPDTLATRLAIIKAEALADAYPDSYILGADQVISHDGIQLHKPVTRARAIEQLLQLQGSTHDLYCAVALRSPDGSIDSRMVHYEMVMRPLDRDAAARYIDRDEPLDCAGSYMLEQGGIQLFSAMRGDDYTAIVGLPLTRVWDLLEANGYFST